MVVPVYNTLHGDYPFGKLLLTFSLLKNSRGRILLQTIGFASKTSTYMRVIPSTKGPPMFAFPVFLWTCFMTACASVVPLLLIMLFVTVVILSAKKMFRAIIR